VFDPTAAPPGPGTPAGTPCYIAPEQLGRDTIPRPAVDIYALGIILYELLTGRLPFRAATPLDTLWQSRHCDPVPPGQLHAKLPRDIEVICLKCLAKDPAHRYASARDLAEDLARFRAREPIQARPASPWERAVKWTTRKPLQAASLAFLVLTLFALVTLAGVVSFREHQHVIDLSRQRDDALRATQEKEKSLQLLRESQARTLRLADQLSSLIQTNRLAPEALQDLVTVYREFVDDPARNEDPMVRRYRARGFGHLSELYQAQGKPILALDQVEHAVSIFRQLASQQPDDLAVRHELAFALDRRGRLLLLNSRIASAEQSYRDSYGLLITLLEANPQHDAYLSSAGGVLHNLANLLFKQAATDREQEAHDFIKKAIGYQEKALAIRDKPKYRGFLKQHLFLAGDGYRRRHDHAQLAALVTRLARTGLSDQEMQDCARFLDQCATDAQADSALSPDRQTELSQRYSLQAQQLRNDVKRRTAVNTIK
jgi:hypothetical protein